MTKQWLLEARTLKKELEAYYELYEQLKKGAYPLMEKGIQSPECFHTINKEISLAQCQKMIESLSQRCQVKLNGILSFIAEVDDSELRLILTYRFINGFSWWKIARKIGEYDESYPRKKCYRFLKKMKD